MTDFRTQDCGSFLVLVAETPAADEWVADHLPDDYANARLIAEAPAMLEALRQLVSVFPYFTERSDERAFFKEAQAILARIDNA